jgi:hypothetical protein
VLELRRLQTLAVVVVADRQQVMLLLRRCTNSAYRVAVVKESTLKSSSIHLLPHIPIRSVLAGQVARLARVGTPVVLVVLATSLLMNTTKG